jgi:hypothetical protein
LLPNGFFASGAGMGGAKAGRGDNNNEGDNSTMGTAAIEKL